MLTIFTFLLSQDARASNHVAYQTHTFEYILTCGKLATSHTKSLHLLHGTLRTKEYVRRNNANKSNKLTVISLLREMISYASASSDFMALYKLFYLLTYSLTYVSVFDCRTLLEFESADFATCETCIKTYKDKFLSSCLLFSVSCGDVPHLYIHTQREREREIEREREGMM